MAGPRKDTHGIVDASALMRRVNFRRRAAAPSLAPWVEHYWLIDWELTEPFEQHVVPHPSVNIVFQRYADQPGFGEVAGIGLELFSIKLESTGQVSAVQFRPGGFRPFLQEPVSTLTNRRVPITTIFPGCDAARFFGSEDDRVAALDDFLSSLNPEADPLATQAMDLVERIRHDREILRVSDFAQRQGLSVRQLQRLFAEYVGVSPKWVILRYRIHEALEHAEAEADVQWARLAHDLGYSDQAHLVRDFTTMIGLSPTSFRRQIRHS